MAVTTTLTGSTQIGIPFQYTVLENKLSVAGVITKPDAVTWTDGDATNKANRIYQSTAASSTGGTSLDLTGSLVDRPGSGQTITFTKIKLLYFKNKSSTVGENIELNGNFITTVVLAGTTPKIIVPPGGELCLIAPLAAGMAVTASTGDVITITAATGTPSYDIVLVGVGTLA